MSIAMLRRELAAKLTTDLGPKYRVVADPSSIDEPTKPTVTVERARVERQTQGSYRHTLNVFVIVPPGASEDALDAALDDVLDALDEGSAATIWDNAQRGVYAETYTCYVISINALSTRKVAV